MSPPDTARPPDSRPPFRPNVEAERRALRSRAWWIAGLYAAAALLWIYFSDQALGLLIDDQALLVKVSVYKGFFFVGVTAILLLVVLRQIFGAIAAHQAEIIRLQRLYAALSQINQSIVWSTSREELFERVCRVLTEYGGIRLAWLGWNDPATHRLTPVAIAGTAADYPASLEIYTDERPEGQGPLGRTFRIQRPYVTNNLQADPSLRMRHEALRRHNLRSAVYLPVRDGDQPGGVLAVYADEVDFFRPREVELLTEATSDLAFGLDNLRREAERRAAAAAGEGAPRFTAQL
ncbi:MAG: GAF domain-containing protein, partial [Opitutaceae bacterium]|nr:GAF domain-containing protein [Opitutaceae bacterium]